MLKQLKSSQMGLSMLSQPLMTLHDVAAKLQVKEETIRHWIRDGKLRAINLGKEWRVAVVDLEQFLNDHANIPSAGAGEV